MNSELDAAGWLTGARRIPSPNCDERPVGQAVRLVVVHAISLPPGVFGGDGIVRLFTNTLDPEAHPYYREIQFLRVSAHFLIRRDGGLVQFVPCDLRAWHAGASNWHGIERCNDFSIGIELEGSDELPFNPPQYAVLARLIHILQQRYPIEDIVGHAEIAPGRKTDPGPLFDWARLDRLLACRKG
jgi:AmpD protein